MALKIQNLSDLLKDHINGPILNQTITRLTALGENYGSLMLKVDLTVKNNDKEETVHTVAKCVPPNKDVQAIMNMNVTFKNEIAWYTTIIPTMIEFQKSHGVENVADFFMEIYATRLSLDPDSEEVDNDGIILCENLAVKGYANVDRRLGFNLPQSKEILKKLATFHAISLALKLEKPEVFNLKVKRYLNKLHLKKDRPNMLIAMDPVIQFLKGHTETSHLVSKVEEALRYNEEGVDDEEPWATAIHCDFWVNNIMLKEEEGKAPKVIILDLQVCGYGSPVEDLLFFLGASVQTDLAEKHFDELIEFYYIELIENLKSLNADTTLFTYESFKKQLKLRVISQFAHCMFATGLVMAERIKAVDTTTIDFRLDELVLNMFSQMTDEHEKKYIFLTKEFAKRNWI